MVFWWVDVGVCGVEELGVALRSKLFVADEMIFSLGQNGDAAWLYTSSF